MTTTYLLAIVVVAVVSYALAYRKSAAVRAQHGRLIHSRPIYHALLAAAAAVIPMALVLVVWLAASPGLIQSAVLASLPAEFDTADALARATRLREIANVALGHGADANPAIVAAAGLYARLNAVSGYAMLCAGLLLAGAGAFLVIRRIGVSFRARNAFERVVVGLLFACSAVAVLTTLGIVFSVLFESLRFFARYPFLDFLTGLQWSPQTAIREDQVGSSGAFGIIPLVAGTLLITFIAMLVAAPIGLFSAIYMAEYASPRLRAFAKPVLEVLAGVPTVVFGFFAALTVAPYVRIAGEAVGLEVASESALAAGLVMGVMIIPFVSSLSDDVINAVPQSLRDGSYGLGATKAETVRKVVLPAALPGIVSAVMLAVSRAVGETMIVVMAAGLAANLTFNPLAAVTTFTVQIKTILVGDQEFDSAKTLSAFALGFVLFFFTLALNLIALRIVRKYREQYD